VHILDRIISWSNEDSRVKALFLVGSYARNTQKPSSDIDLVIITDKKEQLLQLDWIELFGVCKRNIREEYGACTSIRVFYEDNTEIEYGIVNSSWLDSPLDAGTKRVLQDGYILLFGSEGISQNMIETLLKG